MDLVRVSRGLNMALVPVPNGVDTFSTELNEIRRVYEGGVNPFNTRWEEIRRASQGGVDPFKTEWAGIRDAFEDLRVKEAVILLNEIIQKLETQSSKERMESEEKMIQILGVANEQQRRKIRKSYYATHQQDLCECLEKLGGRLKMGKALVLWIHESVERAAIIARTALEAGLQADIYPLIDVIFTKSTTQIKDICKAYGKRYSRRRLDTDVKGKTTGYTQKLLLARLVGASNQSDREVNFKAGEDAKKLKSARRGTVEQTFIQILSNCSSGQLKETFDFYEKNYGDIIEALKEKTTDNKFSDAVRVTIDRMFHTHDYFAQVIQSGLKTLPSDKSAIARVIVSRANVDLNDINKAYLRKYRMSIMKALQASLQASLQHEHNVDRDISVQFTNLCRAIMVGVGIRE